MTLPCERSMRETGKKNPRVSKYQLYDWMEGSSHAGAQLEPENGKAIRNLKCNMPLS